MLQPNVYYQQQQLQLFSPIGLFGFHELYHCYISILALGHDSTGRSFYLLRNILFIQIFKRDRRADVVLSVLRVVIMANGS